MGRCCQDASDGTPVSDRVRSVMRTAALVRDLLIPRSEYGETSIL